MSVLGSENSQTRQAKRSGTTADKLKAFRDATDEAIMHAGLYISHNKSIPRASEPDMHGLS